MIYYTKTITIRRQPTGNYAIRGDKSSQSYKTTPMVGAEVVGKWWEYQHQSDLRLWQKDLIIKLLPSAFKDLDYNWQLTPYLVYAEGAGYSQPHDVAFATLTNNNESHNVYLLGTQEHTWIHLEKREVEKFTLDASDAFACVATAQGQDQLWNMYDAMRGNT